MGDLVAQIQGPLGRFPLLVTVHIDRPAIRPLEIHMTRGSYFVIGVRDSKRARRKWV